MRLIDADVFLEILEFFPYDEILYHDVTRMVGETPTVDAEPVRHGKWIPIIDDYINCSLLSGYKCSLCGRYEEKEEPYCHCGAKMDGE